MNALILAPFSEHQLLRLRNSMSVTYESWTDTRRLLDPDELAMRINEHEVSILVVEADFVFEETFEQVKSLNFVGVCRAAFSQIDVDIATKLGVNVVNTPGRNAQAVAEHTLGLMLALARNIPMAHNYVMNRSWENPTEPYISFRGVELFGATIGIIGLGAIGQRLAKICSALGMKVIGYDPYVSPIPSDVVLVGLDELIGQSDFITVHVPANDDTRGLLNAEMLALLKPSAYLVSASDPSVFDQLALVDILVSKKLLGAAFDVFESHPVSPQNPLLPLDNVILSPHIGGATQQTIERHSEMMTDDILRFLDGQRPLHLVNPEVWPNNG